jgi:hypothetical protein
MAVLQIKVNGQLHSVDVLPTRPYFGFCVTVFG